MRKVYAFDFDGTLTTRDTLIAFIRYVAGTKALRLGFLRYAPLLVLMKLGLYPNWKAKQKVFSHFFKGMDYSTFKACGHNFAEDSSRLLRPEAVKLIGELVERKEEVVIVTASIEEWVQPFFPGAKVLATKVEVDANGCLTGRFLTKNCYGQEKVDRVRSMYPDRDDYYLIAYGDSRGDRELLAFADEAHYKPFRV